jgi:hypothetical protein
VRSGCDAPPQICDSASTAGSLYYGLSGIGVIAVLGAIVLIAGIPRRLIQTR